MEVDVEVLFMEFLPSGFDEFVHFGVAEEGFGVLNPLAEDRPLDGVDDVGDVLFEVWAADGFEGTRPEVRHQAADVADQAAEEDRRLVVVGSVELLQELDEPGYVLDGLPTVSFSPVDNQGQEPAGQLAIPVSEIPETVLAEPHPIVVTEGCQ